MKEVGQKGVKTPLSHKHSLLLALCFIIGVGDTGAGGLQPSQCWKSLQNQQPI